MWWEVMDCIHFADDTDQWWGSVSMVVILRVPCRACNFLTEWLLFPREGFCSMQLVSYLVDVILYGIPYRHWIRLYTHTHRDRETRLRAGRAGFGFRQGGDVYYLRRRVRDGSGVHISRSSYPAVGAAGRGAGSPPPFGAGTGSTWSCASSTRFFMTCCLIKQWIILYSFN
jgi:hypothetical protein